MSDCPSNEAFGTPTVYYLDTIVTMSPKKVSESQKAALAKARESQDSSVAQSNMDSILATSQRDLLNARV
jgi:hypothetical protein